MGAGDTQGSLGSLADDEAALQRGKGKMLAAWGVVLLVVLGGLFALMSGGDEERVYGEIGKKVNGLRQAHFDQFWGCALQGAVIKDIKTNTELMSQVDGRAMEKGAAYAVHLRDTCLPKLEAIEPQLEVLIIPPDMQADVNAMKDATSKLRGAFSALISYLDAPDAKYESEAARIYVENIARGWFEFKQAHAAINKLIKQKLGES